MLKFNFIIIFFEFFSRISTINLRGLIKKVNEERKQFSERMAFIFFCAFRTRFPSFLYWEFYRFLLRFTVFLVVVLFRVVLFVVVFLRVVFLVVVLFFLRTVFFAVARLFL